MWHSNSLVLNNVLYNDVFRTTRNGSGDTGGRLLSERVSEVFRKLNPIEDDVGVSKLFVRP